jgi:hypothetical protein
MRTVLATLAAICLITLAGCTNGTPGGPGATGSGTGTNKTPAIPGLTAANEFTISPDWTHLGVGIKQGETADDTITINRGKGFEEDVTLKFEDLPKGVTIEPATVTIKKSDSPAKATVKIKAADDAAVGKFDIKVIGHPTKGADASNKLSLTVHEKKK